MESDSNNPEKANEDSKLAHAETIVKPDRTGADQPRLQPPAEVSSRKRKAADVDELEAPEPSCKYRVTRSTRAPSRRKQDATGSLNVRPTRTSSIGTENDEKMEVELTKQVEIASPKKGKFAGMAPKQLKSVATPRSDQPDQIEVIRPVCEESPKVKEASDVAEAKSPNTSLKKAKCESDASTPKKRKRNQKDAPTPDKAYDNCEIFVLEDTEQTHDAHSFIEDEDKENLSTPSSFSATTPRYMASVRSSPEDAAKFARSDQRLASLREEQNRLQGLFMQIQDGKPVQQAIANHMKMLSELAKNQQDINMQQAADAREPLSDCSPMPQYIELTHADMQGPGEPNSVTLDEVASYRSVEQIRESQRAVRASSERGEWLPQNLDSREERDAIFRRSIYESYGSQGPVAGGSGR